MTTLSNGAKVLRAGDGEWLGPPDGVRDRFVLSAGESGGRFSLVEHLAPPRALIAPLHRHTREDEYTLVLDGRMGAVSNGVEITAERGDLVWKPRHEWHTFWNADDHRELRLLEIISPGGLEDLFRELDGLAEFPDPETLAQLAAPYGCELDLPGTMAVLERFGLTF
ncbi:MAG: cupin domain-containing protein [Actinomycetes bacterium]